jgi:hypothetical protein
MVIHQQFSDFVLFLFIHVALVDGELQVEQKEIILAKMVRLYPDDTNLEEKFGYETRKYYDFERKKLLTLIKDTFRTFSKLTFVQKYRIYADLFDIALLSKNPESQALATSALKEIMDVSL